MNDHENVRNDLPLYLTGDLAPDEAERLDAHLATCAECRREKEALEETLGMLTRAGATEEAAAELDGFYSERIAPHLRGRRWYQRPLLRAAALLLAFLAGMAVDRFLAAEPEAPPTPAVEVPAPESERREVYEATTHARSDLGRVLALLGKLER